MDYFKILAGFEDEQQLTEEQTKKVQEEREKIFVEFLTEDKRFSKGYSVKYINEEEDGCNYNLYNDKGALIRKYYFSSIEFGAIRKDPVDDKRFETVWKNFMMKKLSEHYPELVEKYFNEWNDEFLKFEAHKKFKEIEKLAEVDSVKHILQSGSGYLEQTKSL